MIPIVDDYGRIIGETNSLVFFQENGNALNEPQMLRLIHRIVKKQNKTAEIEGKTKLIYFTPHQVRHTYTTLAYEYGLDGKVVSERLGHASAVTTLGTYTHLRGEKKLEQEAAANKIRIS